MLDIPTARANRQAARQQPAPVATGAPDMTAGTTSMAPAPPTAQSQTTPYEYAGHGSQDPIAQQVMKDYWSPDKWGSTYDTNLYLANAYDKSGGNFNSPLDPSTWGTVFRGQDYTDIGEKYKAAGGTYFNQFTPAQQAGVPYMAATGEPAPVMNMATGVAETPVMSAGGQITGQTPTAMGGSGSYHTLDPNILSRMWR